VSIGPAVRVLVCAVLVVVVVSGSLPAAALVLDPPVAGRVVAVFGAPTRYGPGHRGVDLATPTGTPVRAPAPGTVTFAGWVVDAAWVTVDHGAVRTTVGPMAGMVVRRGQRVVRGEVVGASGRAHGTAAVHWSLRRGDTYLDPLAAGRVVATLLPDRAGRGEAAGAPARAAAGTMRPRWPRLWVR
jgi:murein DD-endopeptidase MepM/ murein hydrolase activator NlpD